MVGAVAGAEWTTGERLRAVENSFLNYYYKNFLPPQENNSSYFSSVGLLDAVIVDVDGLVAAPMIVVDVDGCPLVAVVTPDDDDDDTTPKPLPDEYEFK